MSQSLPGTLIEIIEAVKQHGLEGVDGGALRHAEYAALREDIDPKEVVREAMV